MNQDRYSLRGVSSTKDEVHSVVDKMSKGLFPGAFCKINPDFLTGNPEKCCVIHSDGSGTKSTIAYLHYKETGDPSAFRKTAQDSIVMNIDDLICIGVTDNILMPAISQALYWLNSFLVQKLFYNRFVIMTLSFKVGVEKLPMSVT